MILRRLHIQIEIDMSGRFEWRPRVFRDHFHVHEEGCPTQWLSWGWMLAYIALLPKETKGTDATLDQTT